LCDFPCLLNSHLISTEKKRKYQEDSKHKKLKTNCLGLLSSFHPEKDLFSKPKNIAIEINKEFNQKLISSIIEDALRKKYPKEDIIDSKLDEIKKRIKKDIDIDIRSMTFAMFFDVIYLPSKHFEVFLRKNANDANYLISLMKSAFGYVHYFEREKGNIQISVEEKMLKLEKMLNLIKNLLELKKENRISDEKEMLNLKKKLLELKKKLLELKKKLLELKKETAGAEKETAETESN